MFLKVDKRFFIRISNSFAKINTIFSINVFFCVLNNVQFNYMHECFERVFCELRWRKEVKRSTQKRWFKPDIFVLNSYLQCVCFTDQRRGHRQGQ